MKYWIRKSSQHKNLANYKDTISQAKPTVWMVGRPSPSRVRLVSNGLLGINLGWMGGVNKITSWLLLTELLAGK